MSLEGQVALVTGASSGIGLAAAEAMSAAGMKLVLGGRRADKLAEHAARLPHCVTVAGDVTDPAVVDDLFAAAGVMQLTAMSRSAVSFASDFVSAITPAFAAL